MFGAVRASIEPRFKSGRPDERPSGSMRDAGLRGRAPPRRRLSRVAARLQRSRIVVRRRLAAPCRGLPVDATWQTFYISRQVSHADELARATSPLDGADRDGGWWDDGGEGRGSAVDGVRSLATRPLIDRVRDEILRSISSGAFPDGRLPGEGKLADRLSVSRTTLRSALRSLEEDGLLTRHRGRPTRINAHVVKGLSLSRVAGFYDLIRESGHQPRIAATDLQHGTAPDYVARRLAASPDAPILVIDRLFLADEQPAIHVREMVMAVSVRGSVTRQAVPNSIFEFAERFCDSRVDHSVVEIIPAAADAEVGRRLDLEGGQPYLRLIETHYSIDARPFIVSDIALVDKFIRFIVVRRRF